MELVLACWATYLTITFVYMMLTYLRGHMLNYENHITRWRQLNEVLPYLYSSAHVPSDQYNVSAHLTINSRLSLFISQ